MYTLEITHLDPQPIEYLTTSTLGEALALAWEFDDAWLNGLIDNCRVYNGAGLLVDAHNDAMVETLASYSRSLESLGLSEYPFKFQQRSELGVLL